MTATQAWRRLVRASVAVRACCELPEDDPLRLAAAREYDRAWYNFEHVLRRVNRLGH